MRNATSRRWRFATIALILVGAVHLVCAAHSLAAERLTYRETSDAKPTTLVGETLVEAQDGGRLFLTDDGRILTIQKDWVTEYAAEDGALVPITDEEIGRRLLAELPDGFAVYRTTNYVIVHNTTEAYVRWVGGLFEQLHRGFYAYWKNLGWSLPDAKFPLVALVFASRADYDKYATRDVGEAARSTIGYYNLQTNQMVTFNVPDAERNVATIVHEATHQLAYNAGLQQRYADNPMWVSEGLAVFFESPDFTSARGWRSIGKVNTVNLARFRKYLPRRGGESLATLLSDDMKFRMESSASDAYSEAWALTYFLVRTKKKEYIQYLRKLSEGKPLVTLEARDRLAMFEQIFGVDLATLDRQFLAYMARVQ